MGRRAKHSGVVRVLDPYHGIERGWESPETSLAMIEETMRSKGRRRSLRSFSRRWSAQMEFSFHRTATCRVFALFVTNTAS
jgi:hypothetical protein